MEKKDITHIAYSDESNYNNPNFASIGIISLEKEIFEELNSEIRKIIDNSGVKEIRWANIRGARDRICSEKIIDFILKIYSFKKFRIDIVIWDVKERKLKFKENDILTLEKMYHHLFKNVLKVRWPDDSVWQLNPDEHSAINWEESKKILEHVSSSISISKKDGEGFFFKLKSYFHVEKLIQINSKENPLCQIGDFFAGMASFSYLNKNLINMDETQKSLIENNKKISTSEKEKIRVINYFRKKCKEKGLEISFSNGLKTFNPNLKINFWLFKFLDHKKKGENLNKWF